MADGNYYSHDGTDRPTITEWLEHGHIGGQVSGAPYKSSYAPPISYKAFPSSASGYVYHALAPVGTASGASAWRVFRETVATGTIEWANGNANWDKTLINVSGYTFS